MPVESSTTNPAQVLAIESWPEVRVDPVEPESGVVGFLVGADGDVPDRLGVDRDALRSAGFDGSIGATLVIPAGGGLVHVAVGTGDSAAADVAALLQIGGALARALRAHECVAVVAPAWMTLEPGVVAQSLVEGILLGRYRYEALRSDRTPDTLREVQLVGDPETMAAGALRGRLLAAATALARDLANSPHSHLSASRLADIASSLAPRRGLGVTVYGREELVEMGCGGLLGVNAGSAEPPRLIELTY